MKIDSHVHVTPPQIISNWEKYAQKEPHFSVLSNNKNNKFAAVEDVVSMLEENKFDKAVVFGFSFKDIGLCKNVNDYVIDSVKRFPDKLTGFAATPSCKDAAKEIERCKNEGLKGVGEIFPEENEIKLDEITRACKEFNLPLLLHVNEEVGHSYPGKINVTLKQVETFVINNPELKIILAHFGGGILFYETMKEIKEKFKNVYYDTAAAPFLYDGAIYRAIKSLGLYKKIIFGSDFPLLSPKRYLNDIQTAGFSEEEYQYIIGKNLIKLLSSE